ncbi:MAG: hypothetical protein QOD39_2729 [Mycobacterium sp.]|jgi:hypothetical protein|nr:hypothetical protein [Mycobacterium sp.]
MVNILINEARSFTNISATTAAFLLDGGLYAVTSKGTWGGGNLALQRLSSDGSTYVTCLTAFTADGYATVSLPPGSYKFAVTTATAVYVDIVAIATSS